MAQLYAIGLALVATLARAVLFPNPINQVVDEQVAQVGGSFAISATLGDNMVLQRAPTSAVVWGFAPTGTSVTTVFNGEKYKSNTSSDKVWRVHLAPIAAGGPHNISLLASSGERIFLSGIMFGDVYVCGGQSNMQFSLSSNVNASKYAQEADSYPNIRLFTVGQKSASRVPLMNLHTIEQKWVKASAKSVNDGPWKYFSAVCWFFGKALHNGLGGKVPIGLISSNWGGTTMDRWMSRNTSLPCGHTSLGDLYNAMIFPYTVGPMAISGFTWYQGESDLGGHPGDPLPNNNYGCIQAAMIEEWRREFQVPSAFYGVVQLSTWCPEIGPFAKIANGNTLLAELRDQQLMSTNLTNVAYATNADYGQGCNIHPPYKQHPGARLANAALSIVYKKPIDWRSPTYASADITGSGKLTVKLNDVTDTGLVLRQSANAETASKEQGGCATLNAKSPRTCAWAELQFDDGARSWVNATVAIGVDKATMVLTAIPPMGATTIIASSYGWGAIPMLTVYRADMAGEDGELPVLPWRRNITGAVSDHVDVLSVFV